MLSLYNLFDSIKNPENPYITTPGKFWGASKKIKRLAGILIAVCLALFAIVILLAISGSLNILVAILIFACILMIGLCGDILIKRIIIKSKQFYVLNVSVVEFNKNYGVTFQPFDINVLFDGGIVKVRQTEDYVALRKNDDKVYLAKLGSLQEHYYEDSIYSSAPRVQVTKNLTILKENDKIDRVDLSEYPRESIYVPTLRARRKKNKS